jgi:hypothetical protein
MLNPLSHSVVDTKQYKFTSVLQAFPQRSYITGVSNFVRLGAAFTLSYRLEGRQVIADLNLLKMLLTSYCKQVAILGPPTKANLLMSSYKLLT